MKRLLHEGSRSTEEVNESASNDGIAAGLT